MKIKKIEIKNFRLLKEVAIDITDMMLLVGKNNSGKTSFFEIFELFLCDKNILLTDFSKGLLTKDMVNGIYKEYEGLAEKTLENINKIKQKFPSIELKITIDLSGIEDYSSIKALIYEFENNNEITLVSKYKLKNFEELIIDYENYNSKLIDQTRDEIEFFDYLVEYNNKYFEVVYYATKEKYKTTSPLISHNKIKDLFEINIIKAKRDVDDTTEQNRQGISSSLWKHYIYSNLGEIQNKHLFSAQTSDIKEVLEQQYVKIFEEILRSIEEDLIMDDNKMKISAEVNIENMLKTNAKLRYIMNDLELGEASNGLGFSNLIYILIEIFHYNYVSKKENKPFNFLFIEEPEAHLHPQMQLTLYKKLESVLKDDVKKNIVVSTHSSHLVSISDFNTINYFTKDEKNNVDIKSLEKFINENIKFEKFLRKYFKVNLTDLFFADKAILYEGASERLLFPMFFKKYDKRYKTNLSNQHISFFEVGGRYAHIFYKLLMYLEMKSLIVADIDSIDDKERLSCNVKGDIEKHTKTIKTSNGVIKDWFNMLGKDFYIVDIIKKKKQEFYKNNKNNTMFLTTQLPSKPNFHCGRTLEEELIIHNADVIADDLNAKIKDNKHELKFEMIFKAFKIKEKIDKEFVIMNAFNIVEKINKTDFALELIENMDYWNLPTYIEEGLKWISE